MEIHISHQNWAQKMVHYQREDDHVLMPMDQLEDSNESMVISIVMREGKSISHPFLTVRFLARSKFEYSIVSLQLPFLVEACPINNSPPKWHEWHPPRDKNLKSIVSCNTSHLLELELQFDEEPSVYYKILLMVSVW